jgi:hypothetical protein
MNSLRKEYRQFLIAKQRAATQVHLTEAEEMRWLQGEYRRFLAEQRHAAPIVIARANPE